MAKQRFKQSDYDGGVSKGLRYKTRKQLKEQYDRVRMLLYEQRTKNIRNRTFDNTRDIKREQNITKAYHNAAKVRGYYGHLSTITG